jgi:hypothetical protein
MLLSPLTLPFHFACAYLYLFLGAGMGLYPNGLRVIRDISPTILKQLQDAGCPYQFRRWMVR